MEITVVVLEAWKEPGHAARRVDNFIIEKGRSSAVPIIDAKRS